MMRRQNLVSLALPICLATISLAASFDVLKNEPRARRAENRRVRAIGPANAEAALASFSDCGEVRSYLIDVAIERVIRYHYSWWPVWGGGPEAGPPDASDPPTDFTTTNTQEEGVDELDIVKTNGAHLYAVENERLHVMESWPADATNEVATFSAHNHAHGLFLRDNRVLVASVVSNTADDPHAFDGGLRFSLLDVTHPDTPQVLRTIDVEGWLVDARLIDGDLYAVVRSWVDLPAELWDLVWNSDVDLPDLPWDAPEEERERILAAAREILRPLIEEIMADFTVQDVQISDWSTLSVLHLDLDDISPVTATGLIADGWTVYASKSNLYVAQNSDSWWWGLLPNPIDTTTSIHKFELDPSSPDPVRYTASGSVDGWTLDQFAFSEHDGFLRVASTEFDWWWGTTPDEEPASMVTVLADDGSGSLREVGSVGGLGPGERIFAVRFMGDKGYVVTFEQIDPLFTLDLSDPYFPKVVGELEITGFSSYLHPIGDEWLLAVGQEADENGRVIGLAVSIFDVRDFADPKLAHRYLVEDREEAWSWSEALSDHHAFTYHRGILSIPAYISQGGEAFSGLLVFSADPENGIHEIGRIDHQDMAGTDGHPWMRRSVYIEDAIYSLSSVGVKVNSLHNPEVELASVPFEE
jgi:uncharacterized secreted protein with C-terminal beta-propeller domain